MKESSSWITGFFWALVALGGASPTVGAEVNPPPAGTNTISGLVRFTNGDPDIQARLGPPGLEGMGSFTIFAYTDPPDPLQTTKSISDSDPVAQPFAMTVAADHIPRSYNLSAYLVLDGNTEEYWTDVQTASPLTSNSPPANVNLDECIALVEIRYQRSDGTPLVATGARATAYQTGPSYGLRARYRQPEGRTENFFVVPSDVELRLEIEVDTGTDLYLNRLTHREAFVRTFACDEKPVLVVTMPDAAALGRITGQFNLVGELELPTDGYLELLGRPVVKAAGPLGNQRYADPGADWPGPDASRTFALENLAPSTDTEPWGVAAEMQFGLGYRFEYFRTPALGEGTNNPGVIVAGGETADLGGTFAMTAARLAGRITLTGPPEINGRQSGLRGLVRAADYDLDQDGIPDGIGPVGIGGSSVILTGTDELAAGATRSAAGGQGIASFAGEFNPVSSAFEGDYIVTVGMLDDQPGVWKQDGIVLAIEHPGTNGAPFVSESIYIAEDEPWQGVLAPSDRVEQPLRYGLAEVCLRLRSPAPFFYPRFIGSTGSFTGLDWEGQPRAYHVSLAGASAPPYSRETATHEAMVTVYLPEGTYTLNPAISVLDADGGVSEVQLPPVEVRVSARERLCLEDCLRIEFTGPTCTTNFGFLTFVDAYSCDSTLTNLSLTTRPLIDSSIRVGYSDIRILEPVGIPRATLRTGHGLFFYFDGYTDHPEYYSNMVVTAVARDTKGRIATREIITHFDFTPPTLTCPGNLTTVSPDGGPVAVDFNVSATDDRPDPVLLIRCDPPSGTVFPTGTNAVNCVAADLCLNTNTCSFQVIVRSPDEDCALEIELVTASTPEILLRWSCLATLQAAETVDGPWRSVVGATSPHTMPADGRQKYFRLCLSGDCSGDLAGNCVPAELRAHEPFDYVDGTPLAGQAGGTGFSGPWTSSLAGSNHAIAGDSLRFDRHCTTGGRMSGLAGHTQSGRTLAAGFGVDGTVLYFSFLLRPEGVLNGGDLGGFHGLQLQGGPGAGSLFIGKPGGAGGGVLAPYVLEEVGGAGQVLSDVTPVIGETALLVVKAEFAAGRDRFTLHVNPSPGSAEPATGITKADLDVGQGQSLMIYSGGAFSLDEIRVGETYESVTPWR